MIDKCPVCKDSLETDIDRYFTFSRWRCEKEDHVFIFDVVNLASESVYDNHNEIRISYIENEKVCITFSYFVSSCEFVFKANGAPKVAIPMVFHSMEEFMERIEITKESLLFL